MANQITVRNRQRKYEGVRQGVSQAEYDRLAAISWNRSIAEQERASGQPIGRLQTDWQTRELYWEQPPDPMEAYYVIFEPTVTRKVVEQQTPANPGIRLVAASTYGTTVPVSIGRRVITGNIIDAEPITPRLEGAYEYTVTERIPRYADVGPS